MIISKTPYRVSFFGGGTDYSDWYLENGGSVLATTIDKYCYITCRYLPPFFEHKSRIAYSLIETVNDTKDINHPSVRETLRFMNIQDGVEIHHDGDLPARSGLGSSSSFTVGLLNALYALQGKMVDKMRLGAEAINIEQKMIGENVGCQDQLMAAFGGFNKINFMQDGSFDVCPVIMKPERKAELEENLMLFFTGISRTASEIAKDQIEAIPKKKKELSLMNEMVNESIEILTSDVDVTEFGKLLNESWKLKRSLTSKISNPHIDEIYDAAMSAGASGGKLLGAGGGGFILFYAKPEFQHMVRESLCKLLRVPFKFDNTGSQVIYYNNAW